MSISREEAEAMQRRVKATGDKRRGIVAVPVVRARANTKARDRGMNKLEDEYAAFLRGMGFEWRFEPIKLRLADRTYYTPDFMVIDRDGTIRFIDTKAYWKSKGTFHAEDDAMVKLKVVAEQFPWFEFQVAWKFDGGWEHKTY